MVLDQIVVGGITAAFAAGGAWVGTQIRIKAVEKRVMLIESRTGVIVNRLTQLITSHNHNHEDDVDSSKLAE